MAVDGQISQLIHDITDRVSPAATDVDTSVLGIDLTVFAGVFDPSRGRSARKMAAAIDLVPPRASDRVLEVGTGSGFLSILMAKKYSAADITAVDILPEAVACATKNFSSHGLTATPRISDLFSTVAGEQTFDYIVFNAPTFHPVALQMTKGDVTLWDKTGTLKQKFLEQARPRLATQSSKILMMYSRYADYDSLAHLDMSGFQQSRLLINSDPLSEAGVLLLTPVAPTAP